MGWNVEYNIPVAANGETIGSSLSRESSRERGRGYNLITRWNYTEILPAPSSRRNRLQILLPVDHLCFTWCLFPVIFPPHSLSLSLSLSRLSLALENVYVAWICLASVARRGGEGLTPAVSSRALIRAIFDARFRRKRTRGGIVPVLRREKRQPAFAWKYPRPFRSLVKSSRDGPTNEDQPTTSMAEIGWPLVRLRFSRYSPPSCRRLHPLGVLFGFGERVCSSIIACLVFWLRRATLSRSREAAFAIEINCEWIF